MSRYRLLLSLLAVALVSFCAASAETWQASQRLNDISETSVKGSRVAGAADGGMYAVYVSNALKYRKFSNGSLSAPLPVATGSIYNAGLAEAGNGDIHIVWEGWSLDLAVGWAISQNGGASFTSSSVANNNSKFPQIAPFGPDGSPSMLLTMGSINYPSAGNNNLNFAFYDGSSWRPTQPLAAVDSEYNLEGIARSPVDGSVWKTYNGKDKKLYIRRFNGTSWDTVALIDGTPVFRCRHGIAVNSVGEVMVVWSQDDATHVKVYSPSTGVGPQIDFASKEDFPRVVAIPSRSAFYLIYAVDQKRIMGRRYIFGAFDPPVLVSQGLGDAYSPDTSLGVAGDGTLYCSWENWSNGSPQQFFSYCTDFRGHDSTPPIFNGPVVDDGATQDFSGYLHATWSPAAEPDGLIHHYEYSIGTAAGLSDVVGWTNNGPGTELPHMGTLNPGAYFINVRAVNDAGMTSDVRSSDGITLDIDANPTHFTSPIGVDSSSRACANVMLAKASDGGLHMAYDVTDPFVHYRKRNAYGTWEEAYGIAPGKFPDLTEDSLGSVHCIYTTDGRENLTMSEAVCTEGIWDAGAEIFTAMNWYPRLVKGTSSRLYMLDNSGSGHDVNFATRDGAWSSLSTLGTSARYGTPDVAVGTDGVVRAVWASGSDLVYRSYNGTWSDPVTIASGSGFMIPRIALDSSNNPVVVWIGQYVLKGYSVFFSRFDGASWSAPKLLGYGHYPAIAVDKNDTVHVVWSFTGKGGKDDILHTALAGGRWTGSVNVSNNSGASQRPAIEVTNDGSVHLAWQDDSSNTLSDIFYCIDQVPVTTGAITGTVKDSSGNLLAGASITAEPGGYTATTRSNGTYIISGVNPGTYSVTASKTFYVARTRTGVEVAAGQAATCDITLSLAPPVPIGDVRSKPNGSRVDLAGKLVTAVFPMHGCIYVQDQNGSCGIRVETQAPGIEVGHLVDITGGTVQTRIVNGVPCERKIAGANVTRLSDTKYTVKPVLMNTRTLGGGDTPDFVGTKGGSGLNNVGSLVKIAGKVVKVDGNLLYIDDGAARESALINGTPQTGVKVWTDGNYALEGDIMSVTGIVWGDVPDGWNTNCPCIQTRSAADIVRLGTTLTVGTIAGYVRDSFNRALGGATVSTNPGGYSTTSAANGSFTLYGVAPGVYTVSASAQGHNDQAYGNIAVEAGAESNLSFMLSPKNGTISGYVRMSTGAAISGATVSAGTYSATSAADGSYTIGSVPPGTYSVTASKAGYNSQTNSGVVVGPGGAATSDFSLIPQSQEKLQNGNFEGAFSPCGWWAGNYPANWGFTWRGSPSTNGFKFDGYTFGGTHGKVAKVSITQNNMEAGLIQQVSGLTPGSNYIFSAEAYQLNQGSNVWIAVDPNGGNVMPQRNVHFDNVTGQWNYSQVSGTVGSTGTVSVFVWAWRQWATGDVYIDNASLKVW